MADIHPPINPHQLDFGLQPHAPSALSFGFGLSGSTTYPHSTTPSQPSPFHSSQSPTISRATKRRLDDDSSDDLMEPRSPTPEARRRAQMKRLKASPSTVKSSRDSHVESLKKDEEGLDENESDIGVMLAMLPPQSLIPLITSLVKSQPSIKPLLFSVMPQPSLESALHILFQAATKLRDAHPYSSGTSIGSMPTMSLGFGIGIAGRNISAIPSIYGPVQHKEATGGMRDSYIQSRIAPHLTEFVTTVTSSLPFFSYLPSSLPSSSHASRQTKPHPSETFTYLAQVTRILLSFPILTQNALHSTLTPRLIDEWNAWLARVDEVLNKEGGMFGLDTIKSWQMGLDEFASAAGDRSNALGKLKELRDGWVARAGWLLGRSRSQQGMDDDEEL